MIIGVAKTRLFTDTRILQIWDKTSLGDQRKLLLLSDSDDIDSNFEFVKVYKLNIRRYLKGRFSALTAIVWHFLVFKDLYFLKPDKLVVFDKNAIPGPLLYCHLFKIPIIYDDHELPNSSGRFVKLERALECLMYKKSERVYVASLHRAHFIKIYYNLNYLPDVIENDFDITCGVNELLETKLKVYRKLYRRILYHQGRIISGRGMLNVEKLVNNLKEDELLLLVGTDKIFDKKNVVTLGILAQEYLPIVYKYVDACYIFYNNDTINNTLCAPNRFYLAKRFNKEVYINDNVFLRSMQ